MHRSAGVTTSAVVVIAGSAFTLLCGALTLAGSAVVSKSTPPPNLPVSLGSVLIVEAIFTFAFGTWGLASGIGLIYLKRWGLLSAIALQCLAALSGAMLLVIPGHRARFRQLMEAMMASMNARMPQPAPFVFPTWFGLAFGFAMVLVILWFLVTRRSAFGRATEASDSQH